MKEEEKQNGEVTAQPYKKILQYWYKVLLTRSKMYGKEFCTNKQ